MDPSRDGLDNERGTARLPHGGAKVEREAERGQRCFRRARGEESLGSPETEDHPRSAVLSWYEGLQVSDLFPSRWR